MAKLRLRVHPLFLALGLYYIAVGRIAMFLLVTLSALAHEGAHAIRAAKLGYRLDSIVLMPYGAVIGGEAEQLKARDQAAVALAGPLLNLVLAVTTMGLWWVFPQMYAFTADVATVNLSLAAVNLIPAYPLDGGRIFLSVLSRYVQKKTAMRIALGVTWAVAALFAAIFTVGCFMGTVNPGALFFCVFLAAGAMGARKGARYSRIRLRVTPRALMRGKAVVRIAVDEQMPLKLLIRNLEEDALNEVLVLFRSGEERLITHNGVAKMLENADIYASIGQISGTLLPNRADCVTIIGRVKTPMEKDG